MWDRLSLSYARQRNSRCYLSIDQVSVHGPIDSTNSLENDNFTSKILVSRILWFTSSYTLQGCSVNTYLGCSVNTRKGSPASW
jgi:hypothetical protein